MIKLPDAPFDEVAVGDYIPINVLKEALIQVISRDGMPTAVDVVEAKIKAFGAPAEECVRVSHATDPKNYETLILREVRSRRSARVMLYCMGKSKYSRAMVGMAQYLDHSSMVANAIDGVTRMFNRSKAEEQGLYYDDLIAIVYEAIELAQSGQVGVPAPAPVTRTATGTTSGTGYPPRMTASGYVPPATTSRTDRRPERSASSARQQIPASRQNGDATPPHGVSNRFNQQPEPREQVVPMSEVEGAKVCAIATCPHCGARTRATVPNADCMVNITCGKCHHKFPMQVRRRISNVAN